LCALLGPALVLLRVSFSGCGLCRLAASWLALLRRLLGLCGGLVLRCLIFLNGALCEILLRFHAAG
jgi:hypothetical protein